MFIHMDPPDHTKYRRMLAGEFTVRRVAELAPHVESVAAEQIEAMREHGAPADLLTTFAKPLVLRVLSDLVGLPYEERERYADAPAITHDPDGDAEESMAVYQQVAQLVGETIERKRKQPGDDIISRLLAAGELSDEELGNIVTLLLFAGYETTESALTVGVMALLHHPEQLAALRADLSRVDAAVEEILRYVTVNQYEIFRTALEDVELAGQLVKKGRPSRCPSRPPTATRRSTAAPPTSTWTGTPPVTWRSATASTSASGRTWPASNCAPACARCCGPSRPACGHAARGGPAAHPRIGLRSEEPPRRLVSPPVFRHCSICCP
ncbi:cytochrome P450 [Streptomyces sp. M19]